MPAVLAGLLAALVAWPLNGLVMRAAGSRGIIWLAPSVEETAKTGLALLLGAYIPFTHLVFGLVEALWDAAGPGRGRYAGMIGLIAHTLFGYGTFWLCRAGVPVWASAGVVYLIHASWNALVIYLSRRSVHP